MALCDLTVFSLKIFFFRQNRMIWKEIELFFWSSTFFVHNQKSNRFVLKISQKCFQYNRSAYFDDKFGDKAKYSQHRDFKPKCSDYCSHQTWIFFMFWFDFPGSGKWRSWIYGWKTKYFFTFRIQFYLIHIFNLNGKNVKCYLSIRSPSVLDRSSSIGSNASFGCKYLV